MVNFFHDWSGMLGQGEFFMFPDAEFISCLSEPSAPVLCAEPLANNPRRWAKMQYNRYLDPPTPFQIFQVSIITPKKPHF